MGIFESPTHERQRTLSDSELNNRPSASGHRFGPDLACSECGVTWDEHQKDPRDCNLDVPAETVAKPLERKPTVAQDIEPSGDA
jgi:hypothetical protein